MYWMNESLILIAFKEQIGSLLDYFIPAASKKLFEEAIKVPLTLVMLLLIENLGASRFSIKCISGSSGVLGYAKIVV